MSFHEPRSAATPYHKPVSSRNFLKFVQVTKVQCDVSSTSVSTSSSSRDTDDGEEYFRFHEYCGLPGEELDYFRPRQRPLKFTITNRLPNSPVLTTAHASAVPPSTETVIVKSPSGHSVLEWFWRLKAKMRGRHNDHKKSLKTLFDLSQFNKKKMRYGAVTRSNPSLPGTNVSDYPPQISSIRSALSALSRKTKEMLPPIQRNQTRPAKAPRSRKGPIATRLISPKRKATTAVTYDRSDITMVTLSGPHRRNPSNGTTVSSFLGSERSDETAQSASTAPTSILSASAARASAAIPSITRDLMDSDHRPISTNANTELTRLTPTSPITTIRYSPAGAPRLISIGKSHAAPPSVTSTAATTEDTHIRIKPMGFKRTKQRPSRIPRDPSLSTLGSYAGGTEKTTRGESAGVTFDQPVGSHLPVSTPHARIASVSDAIKGRLGLGGSVC